MKVSRKSSNSLGCLQVLSDVFGLYRMSSDYFGCRRIISGVIQLFRMLSDSFGCRRIISGVVGFCRVSSYSVGCLWFRVPCIEFHLTPSKRTRAATGRNLSWLNCQMHHLVFLTTVIITLTIKEMNLAATGAVVSPWPSVAPHRCSSTSPSVPLSLPMYRFPGPRVSFCLWLSVFVSLSLSQLTY